MMIKANGLELHVEQRGAGGPTLVFLHYWGGSLRTWQHVVDALSPDYRTVAIDQRGWAKSAAPEAGYALSDLADDVLAVVDALGLESYILIGHSMGGKAAQLAASRRPRGLAGLVLVAPAPPTPLALPLDARQGMVHAYDSRESIVATVQQVLAPGGLSDGDLDTVIADSLAGASPAKAAWPLATSQEDITAVVPKIDVPVIVISGEHDRVDPPEVLRRELLSRIPQARLVVLQGRGHLLPLEAPADLTSIIKAFVLAQPKGGFFALTDSQREVALTRCGDCGVARLTASAGDASRHP
ncbi:alpha/beta fold hydrolase [Luteibacter jiangsuensis]|uniref:Alpha/beta fold hydrolase n=1 Tax=Luteibacter jiangsuensis TaxID=637577 RepID=A0ABX0PXG3_9GAMM|nr:alpha/beta hydrolase [Luteibacter jiangsuensis]NID03250.1 alpha/beta fold hydrolase [Luteibacter jiangsuensis]